VLFCKSRIYNHIQRLIPQAPGLLRIRFRPSGRCNGLTVYYNKIRNRREAEQRAAERAERLIRELGDGVHIEARRFEREALDLGTRRIGGGSRWPSRA
jgi:hypothetical protein